MWTFDNPPTKQLQDKYNFADHAAVAGSRAAVERAAERRRIGIVRQSQRAAADESSRRAGAVAEEFDARARLRQDRVLRAHAGRRDEVARSGSERPGVDGERDGARAGRPEGRAQRGAGIRQAQGRDRRTSSARARRRPASAPTSSRCIRAANTGCIATRSTRMCGWCSRRSSRSRSLAAIRTISLIRATTWTSRCSACTRTGSRSRARIISSGIRKARRMATWYSFPAIPGPRRDSDTLAQLEAERDLYEPATLKILHSRIDTLKKYSATGPRRRGAR